MSKSDARRLRVVCFVVAAIGVLLEATGEPDRRQHSPSWAAFAVGALTGALLALGIRVFAEHSLSAGKQFKPVAESVPGGRITIAIGGAALAGLSVIALPPVAMAAVFGFISGTALLIGFSFPDRLLDAGRDPM